MTMIHCIFSFQQKNTKECGKILLEMKSYYLLWGIPVTLSTELNPLVYSVEVTMLGLSSYVLWGSAIRELWWVSIEEMLEGSFLSPSDRMQLSRAAKWGNVNKKPVLPSNVKTGGQMWND